MRKRKYSFSYQAPGEKEELLEEGEDIIDRLKKKGILNPVHQYVDEKILEKKNIISDNQDIPGDKIDLDLDRKSLSKNMWKVKLGPRTHFKSTHKDTKLKFGDYHKNFPFYDIQSLFFGLESIPVKTPEEYVKERGIDILFSRSYRAFIRSIATGIIEEDTIPPSDDLIIISDLDYYDDSRFLDEYGGTVLSIGSFNGLIKAIESIDQRVKLYEDSNERNPFMIVKRKVGDVDEKIIMLKPLKEEKIPIYQKRLQTHNSNSRYHFRYANTISNTRLENDSTIDELRESKSVYSKAYYKKLINLFILLMSGYVHNYKLALTSPIEGAKYSLVIKDYAQKKKEKELLLLFNMIGVNKNMHDIMRKLVYFVENGLKKKEFDYGNYINNPFNSSVFSKAFYLGLSVFSKAWIPQILVGYDTETGFKAAVFSPTSQLGKDLDKIYQRLYVKATDKNVVNQFAHNFIRVIDRLKLREESARARFIEQDKKLRNMEQVFAKEKDKYDQSKRKEETEKISEERKTRRILQAELRSATQDLLSYTRSEVSRFLASLFRSQNGAITKIFDKVDDFSKWKDDKRSSLLNEFYPNIFKLNKREELIASSYFVGYNSLSEEFSTGIMGSDPFLPFSELDTSRFKTSDMLKFLNVGDEEYLWTQIEEKRLKKETFVHSLAWREVNTKRLGTYNPWNVWYWAWANPRKTMAASTIGVTVFQAIPILLTYYLGDKHPRVRELASWATLSHYEFVAKHHKKFEKVFGKDITDIVFDRPYRMAQKDSKHIFETLPPDDKTLERDKDTKKESKKEDDKREEEEKETREERRKRLKREREQREKEAKLEQERIKQEKIEEGKREQERIKREQMEQVSGIIKRVEARAKSIDKWPGHRGTVWKEYNDPKVLPEVSEKMKMSAMNREGYWRFDTQGREGDIRVFSEFNLEDEAYQYVVPTLQRFVVALEYHSDRVYDYLKTITTDKNAEDINKLVGEWENYFKESKKFTDDNYLLEKIKFGRKIFKMYMEMQIDNWDKYGYYGKRSKLISGINFISDGLWKAYSYIQKAYCDYTKGLIFKEKYCKPKFLEDVRYSTTVNYIPEIKPPFYSLSTGKSMESNIHPKKHGFTFINKMQSEVYSILRPYLTKKAKSIHPSEFKNHDNEDIFVKHKVGKEIFKKRCKMYEIENQKEDEKLESMINEHKKKVEQNIIGSSISRNYEIKDTNIKFDNGIIVSKPIGAKFTANVISREETQKIEEINKKLKNAGYHKLTTDANMENIIIREITSDAGDESGYTFLWTQKTKRIGINFFPKIEMKHIRFLIYSDISPGAKFRPFRYEEELKMLMEAHDFNFPRAVSFTFNNIIVVKDMFNFYSQLFELLLWKTGGNIGEVILEYKEEKRLPMLTYETYKLLKTGGNWDESVDIKQKIDRIINFRNDMIRKIDKDEQELPLRSKKIHRQMISKECRIEILNSLRQSILTGHLSSIPVFAILYMAVRIFEEETEENVDFPEDPYENVKQWLKLRIIRTQGKVEKEKKDVNLRKKYKIESIKTQRSVLYQLIYKETNSIWNTLPRRREVRKQFWREFWPRPAKLEQTTKSFDLDSVRDFFSIVGFYLFDYPGVAGNQTLNFANVVYNEIIKKIYEEYVNPDKEKKVPKDLDRDEIISLFWDFFDKRPKKRYIISAGLTDEDLEAEDVEATTIDDKDQLTEEGFKIMVDACLNVINLSDKYRFGNLKVHMFLSGIDVDKLDEKIKIFEGYKTELYKLITRTSKFKTRSSEILSNLKKIYLYGSAGDTVLDIKYTNGKTIKTLYELAMKYLKEERTTDAWNVIDTIIDHIINHFNRMKEAAGHSEDQRDMENKPFGYFEAAYLKRKDRLEKAKMIYYVTKTIE
jgi:hypothetical protein